MKGVFLLLAGMLNDERIWQLVAERLRARSGWAVEALGFATEDSMQAMARSAAQRLQPHGDVPVVLAGFSMGGYVAQQLLAQGLKPRALALVDSAVRPETEATLAGRQKAALAMQKDFAAFAAQVAKFSMGEASQGLPLQQQVEQSLKDVGLQAGLRHLQAIAARQDQRALLAALSIPALVVCGREDKVTPPEMSQEAADLIPGARLRWIEGAGHMVPLEQPDALSDELLSLAQRAGLLPA
jgi:pimeloyl-ACP methyl ester carboxylesterase